MVEHSAQRELTTDDRVNVRECPHTTRNKRIKQLAIVSPRTSSPSCKRMFIFLLCNSRCYLFREARSERAIVEVDCKLKEHEYNKLVALKLPPFF